MDLAQAPSFTEGSEDSQTRHFMDMLGAANEKNQQAQGLSLSLGSHTFAPSGHYKGRPQLNPDLMNPRYFMTRGQEQSSQACYPGADRPINEYSTFDNISQLNMAASASASTSYGIESLAAAIGKSRYLKPVQALLEEFSDGGRNMVTGKLLHETTIRAVRLSSESKAEFFNNRPFPGENHNLKLKLMKLVALLDEVESRYEKYLHQMEEVVSPFEMIIGLGAVKCYTTLALEAMSKHFCSLREAIIFQINVEKGKILAELTKTNSGLSELGLFDREGTHIRLPLQQLGMIQSQHQVWRPIRGLPETSVSVLRSWLFEHFLHPYPNDNEKLMLASQTGLSKNQVSNWFINARVRLWKPMIEEMYKDEFGESSEDLSHQ